MKFQETIRVWTTGLAIALLCASAGESAAQTRAPDTRPQGRQDSNTGYDYTGPYAQFGVSIGQIDFDGPRYDNNASGGFTLTGGYRTLPWLSAEVNFTYLGGGSVEVGSSDLGDGSFYAFTFGPKFYPLGAFEVEEIPESVQPYGLIQIGGGQFDIENTGFPRSAFMARFIIGLDVWVGDHVGFFVEGGGHATDQTNVDGVGVFTVGGQYRF
jgi:hypothetical protein